MLLCNYANKMTVLGLLLKATKVYTEHQKRSKIGRRKKQHNKTSPHHKKAKSQHKIDLRKDSKVFDQNIYPSPD